MPDSELPLFLQARPEPARRPSTDPPRESSGHVPGEPGLWVFILGDLTLFGAFFAAFLIARLTERDSFASSASHLNPAIGVANTLVLLTSSLLVVFAVAAFRSQTAPGWLWRILLVGAVACAGLFAAFKSIEYSGLLHEGHVPDQNTFFTYYFTLTGIHLLHVVIGSVALVITATRRAPRPRLIESTAVYWHMVDLLWIVLFALLYLEPTA